MKKPSAKNRGREERIRNKILVDAHGQEEQALSWHGYIEERISFPFFAKCINVRETSPLEVGDEVEATELAAESECSHEVFVKIRWGKRGLAVPLAQLLPDNEGDADTEEAVADWHYWIEQGYLFG